MDDSDQFLNSNLLMFGRCVGRKHIVHMGKTTAQDQLLNESAPDKLSGALHSRLFTQVVKKLLEFSYLAVRPCRTNDQVRCQEASFT